MEDIEEIIDQLRDRIQNLELRIEESVADVDEQADEIKPLQDDDLRDRDVEFETEEDENVGVDYDTVPGYLGRLYNTGVLQTDGSIYYQILDSGGNAVAFDSADAYAVELSIAGNDAGNPPVGGEGLPDCGEYPNPWTVASTAAFPYRFKKTSDAGGVVQIVSLDSEELPMMTYRNDTLHWDDVGVPAGGAITISGSGTTRYYQMIDLTLTGASAVSWVAESSDNWATIMALHDDDTEIIPVLTVRYVSSVIQWWVQHQWGTIRMPSNA